MSNVKTKKYTSTQHTRNNNVKYNNKYKHNDDDFNHINNNYTIKSQYDESPFISDNDSNINHRNYKRNIQYSNKNNENVYNKKNHIRNKNTIHRDNLEFKTDKKFRNKETFHEDDYSLENSFEDKLIENNTFYNEESNVFETEHNYGDNIFIGDYSEENDNFEKGYNNKLESLIDDEYYDENDIIEEEIIDNYSRDDENEDNDCLYEDELDYENESHYDGIDEETYNKQMEECSQYLDLISDTYKDESSNESSKNKNDTIERMDVYNDSKKNTKIDINVLSSYYPNDYNEQSCEEDEAEEEEKTEGTLEFEPFKFKEVDNYIKEKGSARIVMVGGTGSGKTVGLMNLLRKIRKNFDVCISFCQSETKIIYDRLCFAAFTRDNIKDAEIFIKQILERIKKGRGRYKKPTICINLDDMGVADELKSKIMEMLYKMGRHFLITLITLLQSLINLQTDNRTQISHLFIYKLKGDKNQWSLLQRSYLPNFTSEQLVKLSTKFYTIKGRSLVFFDDKIYFNQSRCPKWWKKEPNDTYPNFFIGNPYLYLYTIFLLRNQKIIKQKFDHIDPEIERALQKRKTRKKKNNKLLINID